MGQEASCRAWFQGRCSEGKALLETNHVLFRGEFRVKVPFREMRSVAAAGGELAIVGPDGELRLDLGASAPKWEEKILHPPSRLDKLGVKAASKVALVGKFDANFREELRERTGSEAVVPRAGMDLIIFSAASRKDLNALRALRAKVQP